LAAVGAATADVLRSSIPSIRPDLVPASENAAGLVAALGPRRIRGRSFLLLRADRARTELPDRLRALGATVADVPLYRSIVPRPDRGVVADFAAGAFDAVLLTSGESARTLRRWLGRSPFPERTRLVTIGPVTSEAVRALGWRVDRESPAPPELAATVIEALAHP
ncbi:MAG: uroporphyrinogen-III synthase, partial [Candidatus Brocadiae bacterium]|nr:uroporphyrinogen-III synthase [Candidatus Brocadiia bacterium]